MTVVPVVPAIPLPTPKNVLAARVTAPEIDNRPPFVTFMLPAEERPPVESIESVPPATVVVPV